MKSYCPPEDFESKAAYEAFLKQAPEHAVTSTEKPEQRITTRKVNAELTLTFLGLPNTNVVQSVYIGSTNAYALQFVQGGAK